MSNTEMFTGESNPFNNSNDYRWYKSSKFTSPILSRCLTVERKIESKSL